MTNDELEEFKKKVQDLSWYEVYVMKWYVLEMFKSQIDGLNFKIDDKIDNLQNYVDKFFTEIQIDEFKNFNRKLNNVELVRSQIESYCVRVTNVINELALKVFNIEKSLQDTKNDK